MTPYTFINRPAAGALYQALIRDPFYITLENRSSPDPATAREAMLRYYDYAMREARDHGRLTFPPDRTSGAAIWSCPLGQEQGKTLSIMKKEFIRDHLGQASLDAYEGITAFMADQAKGIVTDRFWYLSILGLSPDCQGKGLGRELMAPVLEETDSLGVPVYAESFIPKNFNFYLRLGFKKVKTIDEPVTGTSYTILARFPG
ncbi:MAG: GNAT family N-acetyltransferase [Desulfobacterales bacterium]|nr:GNAT family N-acetyltransferase [Desulfobacterales bacterium]